MLLLDHLLLTLPSTQIAVLLEVGVNMVRPWCLGILERTASSNCAKILDLELLQRICESLVLFAQRNVMPLNPLKVLDAHLELKLLVV